MFISFFASSSNFDLLTSYQFCLPRFQLSSSSAHYRLLHPADSASGFESQSDLCCLPGCCFPTSQVLLTILEVWAYLKPNDYIFTSSFLSLQYTSLPLSCMFQSRKLYISSECHLYWALVLCVQVLMKLRLGYNFLCN